MTVPLVAITMGDPAGVGPEITLKAVRHLWPRLTAGAFRVAAIGAVDQLNRLAHVVESAPAFVPVDPDEKLPPDAPFVAIDAAGDHAPFAPGEVSAAAGEVAYRSAAHAARMALDGSADAVVTAPLSKEALIKAGHHYSGYTDMLAQLTGTSGAVMMLAHGALRVSHVTTHVALRQVPDLITADRIERVVRLTVEALQDFNIQSPKLAIAALNPHGGEGGNFGTEDDAITVPLISRLRAEGLALEGPVPGDTVFVKAAAGAYDAVIAMYHDQGHIPVKLLGFSVDRETGAWTALNGVNITLGLPIIRTSVDHGTAFDIAGRGIAREDSLVEAIEIGLTLAESRKARGATGGSQAPSHHSG